MAVNAKLGLVITAEDKATGAMRKLAKQITGMQKTADKAGKSFKVLGGLVGIGGAGIGAAAITAGFAFNSFNEQAELAFTTILKDGAKARAMIAGIQETAKVTPFDTESLTRATQRLLAFGFKAEDVLPTLTDISDTVSGLGGGAEMIDRITNAFGQMVAKGKVQTEELMQLAEAGIPVWSMLRDNVDSLFGAEAGAKFRTGMQSMIDRLVGQGKSLEEATAAAQTAGTQRLMKLVEGGKLKAPAAISALRKGMAQQFGGLSKVQAQTAAGAASTFKDTLMQLLGDLTKGPFKETAEALGVMTGALDAMIGHFRDLPEGIKNVVSWIATFAVGIGSAITAVAGVGGLLGALGGGTGFLGVLGGLASFLGSAASPFAILAGAFAIAKLAWDRNLAPVFAALDTYLRTFPHVKVALSWANDQAGKVAEWLIGLGASISTKVSVAVQWANDAARALADWASAAAKSVTQTVSVAVQWANDAARGLADWAGTAGTAVTKSISVAVAWAGETAEAIGTWLQGAGAAISRNVQTFLLWGGEVAGSIGGWLEGKGAALARNVETILLWGGEVASSIGGWIEGKGAALARNVSTYLLWAGEVADSIGGWIQGKGDAIGRNVSTYLLWAGDTASRLGDWVAGKGDAIGRNIAAYLGWAGDLASKIGGWVAGGGLTRTLSISFAFLSEAWRKFAEWIGGTGGRVVTIGGGGSVPAMAAGGIVTRPTLAMIGERGPEAVVPLGRGGFGGGATVYVTIQGHVLNTVQFEDAIVSALDRANRRGRVN